MLLGLAARLIPSSSASFVARLEESEKPGNGLERAWKRAAPIDRSLDRGSFR